MSRTYRDIPGSSFRDYDNLKGSYKSTYFVEEKDFHEYEPIERVWDKDNHGFLYSRPKAFTQPLNRKMRVRENQKLNNLVNTSYTVDDYEEHFEDVIHEHPREYKRWWW